MKNPKEEASESDWANDSGSVDAICGGVCKSAPKGVFEGECGDEEREDPEPEAPGDEDDPNPNPNPRAVVVVVVVDPNNSMFRKSFIGSVDEVNVYDG